MLSKEISEIAVWTKWPIVSAELPPTKPGVYVFRLAGGKLFGRAKGESDIAYIGSSRNLRKRLKTHDYLRKDKSSLLERIRKEVGELEIGWKPLEDATTAVVRESDLLVLYARDHIEFPPANNQQPERRLHRIRNLLSLLPPIERQKVFRHFIREF